MAAPKLAFVVAGVQKSGTTTLDAILRHHPQVQMARIKEPHYFDDESRDWQRPDYAELHAHFDAAEGRLRGEATPITLYWRPAVRRLQAYNPEIKIVLILRDPTTRAFANWKKEYAAGLDPLTFTEAIRAFPNRVREAAETEGLNRVLSYVERGFYGQQLDHLSNHFPKAHIHCEIYERFFRDRAAGLARIAQFLDIAPFPDTIPQMRHHPAKDIAYPSALSADDIAFLSGIYRDEIRTVESFVGYAIPEWC